MRRGQTREFELPDDLVIDVGGGDGGGDSDDADGRVGSSLNFPQDGPQPKRVLVVDDDVTVRLYLRARLMLRGHVQLLEAASGEQALELVMTQRFDAVLLDVNMGVQNGYEVCRAIRSHMRSLGGKQPRIYMITSRSGMLDKMRAKMAGADAFLTKPPHPGELSELLAQL